MGFVNKESGSFNSHEWNWSDQSTTVVRRAFHIEQPSDKLKKVSLQALTHSPYVSNELTSGNQTVIRQTRLTAPVAKPTVQVRRKKYASLKLCEANMAMYLNSLDLNLFNPDNSAVYARIKTNTSDTVLSSRYNNIVNNYNKKSFDPTPVTLTGVGGDISHEYVTIKQSKSSPVMPSESEYIELNRSSGDKQRFNLYLEKQGITNG